MLKVVSLIGLIASLSWVFFVVPMLSGQTQSPSKVESGPQVSLFQTADGCMACHNGLFTPSGENVSLGSAWSASMMANSARDPYWQAAVRREVIDHPESREAIEDECSKCHMPMARYESMTGGRKQEVFAHLPADTADSHTALLAADGVSCSVCHQITDRGLGTPESFVGGFHIDTATPAGGRAVYGPYKPDTGLATIMRSAVGFQQTESTHMQKSEVCATCHTLITHALGPKGEVQGELPEQVPYQEWLHSAFREEKSCQDCHMPVVQQPTLITSVLGEVREGLNRHDFRGSNFFMIQMLNRYRADLGVKASSEAMDVAALKAREHLQNESSRLSLERLGLRSGRLEAEVVVTNLAGHKLPTAYPSRRAWLHLTVRDAAGKMIFESGALNANGSILGNDNDFDAARFEPHYEEIRAADEVQIYETIMVDRMNGVTTGLLNALRYVKDNRILPRGFDKSTAAEDIAVHGNAAKDADFSGGSDRLLYSIDVGSTQPGPFTVEVALWYQPIGYRWAANLRSYDAPETKRFVSYYEAMSPASGIVLARASGTAR